MISDVFYGRDNLFTCTSKIFNATKLCSVPTPKSIIDKVHLMCTNENKCKVPVTTTFLQSNDEEICFGIRKYLKVKYACYQPSHFHMVCTDGCSSSCWPLCQPSCCHPPPLNLTTNISQPLLMHQHEIVIQPEQLQQCAGGCPTHCAPLCQPTCCKTEIPSFQLSSLSSISTCPDSGCSSSCLPLCDPTCCLLHKKKDLQQFNQPPPIHLVPSTCPGQCSSQCAPMCSPSCCLSQSTVLTCPAPCSSQCAPSCQPSCCQSAPPAMMMSAPLPPQCPTGCSSACAPLCQPTCCQTSMPASSMMMPSLQTQPLPPPRPTCPVGCPGSCLPMCQPICCSQGHMMPPPAPVQMPQMMPMATPSMPLMGGCPSMCGGSMCTPSCPPRCCVSTRGQVANPRKFADARELQQRKTYQQMLTHFRRKQLQRYFYGRK